MRKKEEKKEVLKTKHKKLKKKKVTARNPRVTRSGAKSAPQNKPRGHDMLGATTMH